MRTDVMTDRLLRIGVGIAFIYPPVSAWFDPFAWVGYFPPFALDMAAGHENVLLHLFGVCELIIGLWILSGWRIYIPSTLATVALILIVGFNWNQMDVLFRDISIALMSLSLVITHKPNSQSERSAP